MNSRQRCLTFALAILPMSLAAQTAPLPASDAEQITAAVLPLPTEFRETARVLGYHAGVAKLLELREGTGPFTCLATDPSSKGFHVACYHKSMEPFMARGRELRANGVKGDQVDSTRFAEVRKGTLKMPTQPASLYSLTGPAGSFNASTGTTTGARSLFVVYMPGATTATTGLSAKPVEGTPWIMYPGTPKAHIMFVPKM